jgi:hypothetical protein
MRVPVLVFLALACSCGRLASEAPPGGSPENDPVVSPRIDASPAGYSCPCDGASDPADDAGDGVADAGRDGSLGDDAGADGDAPDVMPTLKDDAGWCDYEPVENGDVCEWTFPDAGILYPYTCVLWTDPSMTVPAGCLAVPPSPGADGPGFTACCPN